MEGDQELRYMCKLCNKRCPCAKSLGGHMRSHSHHMSVNSSESEEKVEPNMKKVSSLDDGGRDCERDSGFELGGHSGYGLRENPRKTWKAVDSVFPLDHEKVCKQCGKGFQSLKALCGHMACHSEKERVLKDDYSWIDENQKVVMDSQSDTEAEAPRQRRKRRTTTSKRYKRIVVKSSSLSLANGSSSVSEIEQEQEDVALCLMMLSRDSGNWGGLNSVTESSDNNSVVLETKSSSIDMGIGKRDYLNCVYNGDETLEIKKIRGKKKFKSVVMDTELLQFENSDSGCFRNGAKKVESDVSVDGFLMNDEYKKPKVDGGTRLKVSDAMPDKGLNRLKCKGTELRKGLIKEKRYDDVSGRASNPVSYDSRKRFRNGSCNPELYGETCKKTTPHGSSNVEKGKNSQKRSKYESCSSNKNPTAQDLSCNAERRFKPKKSKGHECPICFKVFKSGQALGGHKRSHFTGSSEDKCDQNPVIKEELPEFPDLLDLNLPAPIE